MSDLKCHFDAGGWLRGPVRIAHLSRPNHGTDSGPAVAW